MQHGCQQFPRSPLSVCTDGCSTKFWTLYRHLSEPVHKPTAIHSAVFVSSHVLKRKMSIWVILTGRFYDLYFEFILGIDL